MKILVATEKPFAAAAVDGIRQVVEEAGHELVLLEKGTKADLIAKVADAAGLIVRSDIVDKEVFDAAPLLKVVVRAGAGYDNIDLAEATAHGVCVMNTPGQNSNAVAELVFGMAVLMIRNRYNGKAGSELKGKTLGIHAFGQVGRNVARIAQGFGMQVSALDPWVKDEDMAAAGVTPVHSIEELYKNNQFVSLHIPATAETRQSVGKALIALMPKGGVLINTARKEVIDEASLAEALAERPDIRYIADVKPDNADALAEQFGDRVFFTPKKMGAQTAEANINAGIAAARQVVAHLLDGWNRFQVNKQLAKANIVKDNKLTEIRGLWQHK
ncbi:MAG: NAD(P)-dependent oxidoreductase [Muribaculaceae bacterium]